MRRPYSLDHYRKTVEKVRRAAPQVGLTSDIIAGFPGESEEAFGNTLQRILEFDFVDFHPFPYSDRPDTPGEKIKPKVRPAVIRERMNRLRALKKECLARSAQRAQGREYRVIVERHNREQQAGLTDEGLRVFFPLKEEWLGKETRVKLTGAQAGAALAEWV
jgi:threonylcarbamoyladenosine tRNA methylthiotransferase MtaB